MKYALIALALSLTACGQPLYYHPVNLQPIPYQPITYNPALYMPPAVQNHSMNCQSYMVGTTMQTNCN